MDSFFQDGPNALVNTVVKYRDSGNSFSLADCSVEIQARQSSASSDGSSLFVEGIHACSDLFVCEQRTFSLLVFTADLHQL